MFTLASDIAVLYGNVAPSILALSTLKNGTPKNLGSVIKRPTDSTTSTTSGQTDTMSGQTSTTSGQTNTSSGKTSTRSGKTSTSSGKTSTRSGKTNSSSGKRVLRVTRQVIP